ncbi:hypothetical protein [Hydrogenophaga pseudoflava]|uniref:hypothetical protein n=1 Tax=Hydrogenophaga pseudoflava TaxID=47421 RepID=UPI0027E3E4F9|nr:hypothetical protein [Hydrogenophaga pseudoflava]MDQ7746354.1 hypothetical protein [Hydrogenophaga pseudoflava]
MNLAEALNLGCACQTLETARLREQLETEPALAGLTMRLADSHPHLFSRTAVFLDARVMAQITDAVAALERVIARPAWQQRALDRAPQIAGIAHGPAGVFMGYDFHLADDGPRLIEINSNAGGAFLNAALARAHRACCESFQQVFDPQDRLRNLDEAFVAMFRAEWQSQRGDAPLRNVVIVDDVPDAQYLAPEFQMARALFAAHGLIAVVADPRELQWRDGALWHPALPAGTPVDLVYNRLTDFYLQDSGHDVLQQAYRAGSAVVTPHPRTHALYADKRNLATLSDAALLEHWGVGEADRALLRRVVPATQRVTAENADALWAQRRTLFFKPAAGFGARAAYRGDKLTRRVWDEILAGDYVAQTTVPPSERLVRVGHETMRLKLDLRAYTYRGQMQLLAARTWSGQTTNFRTEGGGFSPVVVLPATASFTDISPSQP